MNIKPLGARIIIEKKMENSITSGGLIIPNPKEKNTEGIVVEVFEDFIDANGILQTPKVKKGQSVIISEYMGTAFEVNGKKLFIIKESEILAIINN